MYLIMCLGEQKYPVISLNPIYLVHEVQIFRRLSRSNGCIDFGARWLKSVENRSSRKFYFDLKVWWWGYGDTASGHGTPMVMVPHLPLYSVQ